MKNNKQKQIESLASEIAKELDNNQLTQLIDCLDDNPLAVLEAFEQCAKIRNIL